MEVGYPSNAAILLGNDESTGCPLRSTTAFQDANLDEMIQLAFECISLRERYPVWTGVNQLCAILEVQVILVVRIRMQLAIKELWKLAKEACQISSLFGRELYLQMREFISIYCLIFCFHNLSRLVA